MLTANSAAILTDAFPADQRGLALGTNQIAAIAGQFIGLSPAACWPPGTGARCSGSTSRSASSARSGPTGSCATTGRRGGGRIDWWGNITFAVGLSAVLIGVTYGHPALQGAHHGLDEPRS